MLVSIQPLDSHGNPTDKAFTSDWDRFIQMNDGFRDEPGTLRDMESVLRLGAGYIIGGGAAGAFKLKKVNDVPPIDRSPENLAYISALKPGEEVVECGESGMKGYKGTVYLNNDGLTCVRWILDDEGGYMGTTVTWGTRRVSDVDLKEDV